MYPLRETLELETGPTQKRKSLKFAFCLPRDEFKGLVRAIMAIN
mgnify:CR=1 FL=1